MKPMTKERLEEIGSIANGVFNQDYAIFTTNEMNECLSEIQRLRGALENVVDELHHDSDCSFHFIGRCDCWIEKTENKIKQALSPSDETEVKP